MKKLTLTSLLVTLALTISHAQEEPPSGPNTRRSSTITSLPSVEDARPDRGPSSAQALSAGSESGPEHFGVSGKFRYYVGETYCNPGFITAPAFRAGIRMASPPGHFPTEYPAAWRQGPEGFGRNYGDAMAQRVSFQTARFVSGALFREDPRYAPSSSHHAFQRSLHAFGYTFLDRSDSGHRMPALANIVGAAAAGFVGNAYLPPGFADLPHAGQRATLQLGFSSAGNLYREFAPQMPKPLRIFIELIGR